MPQQFRDDPNQQPNPHSLAEVRWFDLFQDQSLRTLIEQSLKANYEARIAAQRVLQAQGQFGATRSGLFPNLDAEGGGNRQGFGFPIQSTAGAFGSAAWELDLFGKLRRATEAARADLLASQENQRAVIQSLVAQVTTAYFDLREYDAELEIVRESIVARARSVNLVAARLQGGVSQTLDLDQAKSLVQSARAQAAQLEKAVEQTENFINFLQGKNPAAVARGKALVDQPQPPAIPAGLPSELLDRRPDVRAAEMQLVAANARVGVAKAAFFPSINLTAAGGYQSVDLIGIVERTGTAYGLGGLIDLPVFDAGRRSGNYKFAKAQRQEMLINYEQAVNGAFREVSDALIAYQKAVEYRSQQEELANTLRHQSRMATARYSGGVASYLEVLDTERQRLTAEQQLAQAQRDQLVSIVQVYKALGGGWSL
jgi:multidrug efflux system outer membrane protein